MLDVAKMIRIKPHIEGNFIFLRLCRVKKRNKYSTNALRLLSAYKWAGTALGRILGIVEMQVKAMTPDTGSIK